MWEGESPFAAETQPGADAYFRESAVKGDLEGESDDFEVLDAAEQFEPDDRHADEACDDESEVFEYADLAREDYAVSSEEEGGTWEGEGAGAEAFTVPWQEDEGGTWMHEQGADDYLADETGGSLGFDEFDELDEPGESGDFDDEILDTEARFGLDALAGLLDPELGGFGEAAASHLYAAAPADPEQEAFFLSRIGDALRRGAWAVAARAQIRKGERDEDKLTNQVFFARHPELGGRKLRAHEKALAREWRRIRDELIRPLIAQAGAVVLPSAPEPALEPVPASGSAVPERDTWNMPPPKTEELPIEIGANKSLTIHARLVLFQEFRSRALSAVYSLVERRPDFRGRQVLDRWRASRWAGAGRSLLKEKWRIFFSKEEYDWLDTHGYLRSWPFLRRESVPRYQEALQAEFALRELDWFQPHYVRLFNGISVSFLHLDDRGRFTLSFPDRAGLLRLLGKALLSELEDHVRDEVLKLMLGAGLVERYMPLLGLASMLNDIRVTERNQRLLSRQNTRDGAAEARQIKLRLLAAIVAADLIKSGKRRGAVADVRRWLLRQYEVYARRADQLSKFQVEEDRLQRLARGFSADRGPEFRRPPALR